MCSVSTQANSATYFFLNKHIYIIYIYIYIYFFFFLKKKAGQWEGQRWAGWKGLGNYLHPWKQRAEDEEQNASEGEWGQHTQRGQGPWCVPQTHREKAEELGLSQSHPSGLQRPWEAAGTCPVGKRVHGRVVKKGMDGRRQMCFRRFSVVLLEKAAGGRGTHTEVKGSVTNSGSWSFRGYCWTRWGWEDGRAALGVGSGESVAGGVGHQGRSLSQQCWGLRSAYNHSTQ